MLRLILVPLLLYGLAVAGTVAGLIDTSLAYLLPHCFVLKVSATFLLATGVVIGIWPLSAIPFAFTVTLGGAWAVVHFWFPQFESWMRIAVLVSAGLGLVPFLYLLAIARRVSAWFAIFAYVLGTGFVVSLALPPAAQFDVTMGAVIAFLIVAAMLLAAGFTYLFLKAFEKVGENFLHAFLLFLPVMGAPFYLIARQLAGWMSAAIGTPGWWGGLSLGWDATLALEGLLLLTVLAIGKKFSTGHFVPLVAWKFLKSQRQVHTWKTRRLLSLRALIPQPRAGRRPLSVAAEIMMVFALATAGILFGDSLRLPPVAYPLIRLACSTLAAGWLGVRALTGTGRAELAYLITAIAAAAMAFYFVWPAQGVAFLSTSTVAILCAIMLLPAALFALQLLTRTVLLVKLARGNLSAALNPCLAPPIETRLKQGIGSSSFVSVVGVSIGVWALIVVLSVMSGFSGELKNRIINTKDHLMLKASRDKEKIEEPLALCGTLREVPGVRSASAYVEGEAMMSSSVNISATVTIRGIPGDDEALAFLQTSLVSGSTYFFQRPEELVSFPGIQLYNPFPEIPQPAQLPTPDDESGVEVPEGLFPMPAMDEAQDPFSTDAPALLVDGLLAMPLFEGEEQAPIPPPVQPGEGVLRPIIIGIELSRSMGVNVGSRITVISPDGDVGPMGVQPKARQFLVAGVFQTGMYDYDLKLAYMFLPDAQKFFGLGNLIDHVDVRLTDLEQTDEVRDEVEKIVAPAGIEVMTWKELNRNLFSALELERVVMFVVLGFIILIASFNIVTSLVIIIRKRVAAISILRTMGARVGHITGVFFLLGAAVGLFGTASGVIMGLSSCGVIGQLGLTLPKEYYIRSLPMDVDGLQVLQIALAALVITALASLYPGRLASRIILVEGLKDER